MKANDPELKAAFRAHFLNGLGARKKGCPAREDIWGLFSGRNAGKREARTLDHITACASCFGEFEAFLEISRAEKQLAHEVRSRSRPESRRAPWPIAWRYAAASLIVIAVLAAAVLSTKWWGSGDRPAERGRLSGQVRLIAPGQEASIRTSLIFRWEPVALSDHYVIEVFDDSLLPLWKSSQIKSTSWELPTSVKEKMATGKPYFWMLTSFSASGLRVESSLEEFEFVD